MKKQCIQKKYSILIEIAVLRTYSGKYDVE